jgi:hypothetical protein
MQKYKTLMFLFVSFLILWGCAFFAPIIESKGRSLAPSITDVMITWTPTTPQSTLPPTITKEIIKVPDLVDRLCPSVERPAGVFLWPEISQYPNDEDVPIFSLYKIMGFSSEQVYDDCTLRIGPPPTGDLQFAGDSLYWKSYNYETEQMTVYQFDPSEDPGDDIKPHHLPLRFTTLDVSVEKSGLVEFVVSDDGTLIAWSKTDPVLKDDGYVYVHEVYAGGLVPLYYDMIWFDVYPEEDGIPHIIRLREISSQSNMLYYSDEPVGMGRQWPYPAGRYSNLYSISLKGGVPKMYFECGVDDDHWCISDYSEELDLLVYIKFNVINLITLGGESIGQISFEDRSSVLVQAHLGSNGDLVFLTVQGDEEGYNPPEMVSIYVVKPPYIEPPALVHSDPGIRTIYGWLSDQEVLTDLIVPANNSESEITPIYFNIIDVSTKSSKIVTLEANGFEEILP